DRRVGGGRVVWGWAVAALRRGSHAINTGAEIGGVEVTGQELLFPELAFQPAREDRLLDLALDRAFRGKVGHASKLLSNRASALARAPRKNIANHRTQHGGQIEAAVLVKVAILDGNDGA